MKNTWFVVILLLQLFGGVPLLAQQSFDLGVARSTYRVGPGDGLRIGIFYAPVYDDSLKIAGDYAILPDGTLSLPLVGTLPVEGLEVSEVTALLNERYSTYFKNATVSVNLSSLRPVHVVLTGEVNRPGPYELKPGATMTTLLQAAAGVTEEADVRSVLLTQEVTGTRKLNLFDLIADQSSQQRDILLADGDRIVIPKAPPGSDLDAQLLTSSSLGSGKIRVRILGDINAYVALDTSASFVPIALTQAGLSAAVQKEYDVLLARRSKEGKVTRTAIDLGTGGFGASDNLRSGDVLLVTKRPEGFFDSIYRGLTTAVSPLRDLLFTLILFRQL
ncbi:polysaccharide biosynthesis/export family protein [Anthocerotibacter panamensis]|uniref:polysaccharide biosynthesis/export family protein n=1 Tax=Anthocerotibacter panamensis TaxID=2857077 RepID=UPI001C402F46|nr:polysaccharide biosynthesis/export family protein [Anthocerotibacter panamensis]